MKKLLVLLLSAFLVFSLCACGGKSEPAPAEVDIPAAKAEEPVAAQAEPAPAAEPAAAAEPAGGSEWLQSKSGKFYSQFENEEMYMEYEMDTQGTAVNVVTATKGDKVYMQSDMGGQTLVTIFDEGNMYIIDHASKTVMKLPSSGETETVDVMIEEDEVDFADFKTGKREIDGKTYDTEEWTVDGARSILCFDGDKLAYIIGETDGEEMVIKVLKFSNKVDDSLFEIPADYEVMSF